MVLTVKYKILFCGAYTVNHYHSCGLDTHSTCGVDNKGHTVISWKTFREYFTDETWAKVGE